MAQVSKEGALMAASRIDSLLRKAASTKLLCDLEEKKMTGVSRRHRALNAQLTRLDRDIERLENWLKQEATASSANPQLGMHFASFAAAVRTDIAASDSRKKEVHQELKSVDSDFKRAVRRKMTLELAAEKARAEVLRQRTRAMSSARLESMIQRSQREDSCSP